MKAIEERLNVFENLKDETLGGADPRGPYTPASIALTEADYKYRVDRANLKAIAEGEVWP